MVSEKITQSIGLVVRSPRQPASEQLRLAYKITRIRSVPYGAQNMPTLFDLSSFTGSLEVTSTEPIVSLSVNFEADAVFSSLPPGELDAAAQ